MTVHLIEDTKLKFEDIGFKFKGNLAAPDSQQTFSHALVAIWSSKVVFSCKSPQNSSSYAKITSSKQVHLLSGGLDWDRHVPALLNEALSFIWGETS